MKGCLKYAILLLVLCSQPSYAQTNVIVRSQAGASLLQTVCRLLGCEVIRGLNDPGGQLFLLRPPGLISPTLFLSILTLTTGIVDAELDSLIQIVGPTSLGVLPVPGGLLDSRPVNFAGGPVWNGYASQPAAARIRAPLARTVFDVDGAGIVAVIDTGVDGTHPALSDVVIPGYDFTRNQAGTASETADVTQSTAAIVDGSPTPVNSSTVAVLDQSTAAIVDQPGFAAFGHGTMVAGIVHLVSPRARIMPLKAFKANGQGYASDVIRAVYWAVSRKASVLNMSFSMTASSYELKQALDFAISHRATCVAAAGNSGSHVLVYPAAYSNTMGVASTDMLDRRSSFSNYGNDLVWVAAPGEGIISTYPFSTYAAGWGTSFSAPFVSGTAALLVDFLPGIDHQTSATAIAHAQPIGSGMGNGRVDAYLALRWLSSFR